MARLAREAPAIIRHGDFRKVWIFAIGLSESAKLAINEYNSVGRRATGLESAPRGRRDVALLDGLVATIDEFGLEKEVEGGIGRVSVNRNVQLLCC